MSAGYNGSITNEISGKDSDFAPEFRRRFVKYKSDDTTDVLIDTKTGVQYLMVKPTKYEQGNSTVTVIPLIDSSGFPLIDERFVNNEKG